jgi:hypothetical protein
VRRVVPIRQHEADLRRDLDVEPRRQLKAPGHGPGLHGGDRGEPDRQGGPNIAGDIKEIVIVKTNADYDSNPGHAGTGVVVAKLCG